MGIFDWFKGKKNRSHKSYYQNGQIKEESNYKDDKRNGLVKSYYENGQLAEESTYKDDKRNGLMKKYNENGQLEGEANWNNSLFKAGLRTGTWYKEDGVEIYDGDYVFEIFQKQITILSVKDDFETVATISFPGNLGLINFQNNTKNIEQRAVVLRSLIASNP